MAEDVKVLKNLKQGGWLTEFKWMFTQMENGSSLSLKYETHMYIWEDQK